MKKLAMILILAAGTAQAQQLHHHHHPVYRGPSWGQVAAGAIVGAVIVEAIRANQPQPVYIPPPVIVQPICTLVPVTDQFGRVVAYQRVCQ
jgi:hypothetical protein